MTEQQLSADTARLVPEEDLAIAHVEIDRLLAENSRLRIAIEDALAVLAPSSHPHCRKATEFLRAAQIDGAVSTPGTPEWEAECREFGCYDEHN